MPSDVGSLDTEILISMNPGEGYKADTENSAMPNWKSKHVYGYKRPRNRRSKTMSSVQIAHDYMALMEEMPNQSFTARPAGNSDKATLTTMTTILNLFVFDFCRFCVVIRFFHPRPI